MIINIKRDGLVETDKIAGIQQNLIINDKTGGMAIEYIPNELKSSTGIIIMHSDANYMSFPIVSEIAKRGFLTIGVESIEGGEFERKLLRLNDYIAYLKNKDEINTVAIIGHSGGATLMTAYQAIAENGPEVFQSEEMIYKTTIKDKLIPADYLILLDANYGNGVMTLLSVDPSVTNEEEGINLNKEFDLFSKENGYDKENTKYSEEFKKKYWCAQAKRNNKLVEYAKDRLSKIQNGEGNYLDDEPFIIVGANQPKPNNRMLPQDTSLLSHTKEKHDLISGDGSITNEIVYCLRTAEIDKSFTNSFRMGTDATTIKAFLSSQAILAEDDFAILEDEIVGVKWNSCYASPIGNIEHITIPSLFIGMTGSYEYLASEMIYNHAPMEKKKIAFVKGAGHNFVANRRAEKYPGEFGNTDGALFDYVASWLYEIEKGE